MPRTYLVDAHNALYRLFPSPPENADEARRVLVQRAQASLRKRGDKDRAHLVFDTTPAGKLRAGTSSSDGPVAWSYAVGSADEEILRILRVNDARVGESPIVVVTDDRELRGRASQLGASTLRVHEWFEGKDAVKEREARQAGPPLKASDFGFETDTIDLDADPEDL